MGGMACLLRLLAIVGLALADRQFDSRPTLRPMNPASPPKITLHLIPASHPCRAAVEAVKAKQLEFESVILTPGEHADLVEGIYGEGCRTVPGMLVDGEPVHTTSAINRRLEQIAPEPSFYPAPIADAVAAAEAWGDSELQPLGRILPWGAMYFRPDCFATYGGGEALDPAGTDYAIRWIRAAWKYNGVSAVAIATALESLPALLDHADGFVAAGLIGGATPTAADLQILSTLRLLMTLGDLTELIEVHDCGAAARRLLPGYDGSIPPGAFPAGWVRAD